jgi:hypothetical protein
LKFDSNQTVAEENNAAVIALEEAKEIHEQLSNSQELRLFVFQTLLIQTSPPLTLTHCAHDE